MAKCPVCQRDIDEQQQQAQVGQTMAGTPEVNPELGTRRFHNGKWYSFDTIDCRSKFMANPDLYIKQ